MLNRCLVHPLTDRERRQFEDEGYVVVEDALPSDLVAQLVALADDLDRDERARQGLASFARMNHYDVIGRDPRLLELLDYPTIFAKVWGLLGWNIQLYHTHLTVNPTAPVERTEATHGLALGWHQDSGQLNGDLETHPRPRIYLKVGYFISDT